MKGKITIMLAENDAGQQMMSIEGGIERVDKNGFFAILDCMMRNFNLSKAEKKEFALRLLAGTFKHKEIDSIHERTNPEEHRAYKGMLERMLE